MVSVGKNRETPGTGNQPGKTRKSREKPGTGKNREAAGKKPGIRRRVGAQRRLIRVRRTSRFTLHTISTQIPDPRSQIPDPRDPRSQSQVPDPRSQIPGPRSQMPDPNPRSQIPGPRSKIPDPRYNLQQSTTNFQCKLVFVYKRATGRMILNLDCERRFALGTDYSIIVGSSRAPLH